MIPARWFTFFTSMMRLPGSPTLSHPLFCHHHHHPAHLHLPHQAPHLLPVHHHHHHRAPPRLLLLPLWTTLIERMRLLLVRIGRKSAERMEFLGTRFALTLQVSNPMWHTGMQIVSTPINMRKLPLLIRNTPASWAP